MKRAKNVAIVLVILAGLASSYLILKNPGSRAASEGNDEISKLSQEIISKNPIQWVEKAKEQISSIGAAVSSGGQLSVSFSQRSNLTNLVGQQMFGGVQKAVQSGNILDNFDPNDPKNQEIIEKAMADSQNMSLFGEPISDKDLKISQDNSVEAKSKYFSETAQIILKNFNESNINFQKALEIFTNNLDISGVGQIADAYSKILDGFLNIQVPSDYLDLHKRYVILLKKAKETYLGLADYSNDPVRASLSMQLVSKIAEAELEIKQEYYQKSLNLGL